MDGPGRFGDKAEKSESEGIRKIAHISGFVFRKNLLAYPQFFCSVGLCLLQQRGSFLLGSPAFRISGHGNSAIGIHSRYYLPPSLLIQKPILIKETASISHLHFSPASPHTLAISSSARVQIYNANSRQLIKSISRFKDTVLCAEFRKDGKLLLASDKGGAIQVFDLSSRAILRHWIGEETHGRLQVSKVKWMGLTSVVSAGDDNTVKLWDITSKSPVHTFTGHQDYVRALELVPDTNLILSGSLDGTGKLWDPRVPTGDVATFQHGEGSAGIVNSVLALKGGTTFLTGGGSGIKVWDMTAGVDHPVKEMWNHQKEISALCASSESRVLAGGLDGHVKIYDTSTWKVVHGVKYPAGILSVSLSVCLLPYLMAA
jgi:U3 small nucleolar RNA-associated protein 15